MGLTKIMVNISEKYVKKTSEENEKFWLLAFSPIAIIFFKT